MSISQYSITVDTIFSYISKAAYHTPNSCLFSLGISGILIFTTLRPCKFLGYYFIYQITLTCCLYLKDKDSGFLPCHLCHSYGETAHKFYLSYPKTTVPRISIWRSNIDTSLIFPCFIILRSVLRCYQLSQI